MNSVTEHYSERINEKYYEISHGSGLKIFVWPKQGYSSSYAVFGTAFGSINNTFKADGELVCVPDGIAHYLEHKLFECEDGDAFTKYAQTGANANAYTSFDKTCYLFSCTEQFEKCLKILLDFVRSPYFTEETVRKEQGIIGQEIKMYEDSPEWRVMTNMLTAMYHNHPVRVDIAGTVESIAKITPQKLYACYNAYYNLNNMAMTVVGNVTVKQVLAVCDECLTEDSSVRCESVMPDEPYEVVKPYIEQKLAVAMPLFSLGFKHRAQGRLSDTKMAQTDVLLFMLASSTSEMYRELMDKGLINSTFSYEVFEGKGYNSVMFTGESRDPLAAAGIIKKYINDTRKNGFSPEDFECAKRACYGDVVSSLNSADYIANCIEDMYFSGREIFGYFDSLADMTLDDVSLCFSQILDTENSSLSVITG